LFTFTRPCAKASAGKSHRRRNSVFMGFGDFGIVFHHRFVASA